MPFDLCDVGVTAESDAFTPHSVRHSNACDNKQYQAEHQIYLTTFSRASIVCVAAFEAECIGPMWSSWHIFRKSVKTLLRCSTMAYGKRWPSANLAYKSCLTALGLKGSTCIIVSNITAKNRANFFSQTSESHAA